MERESAVPGERGTTGDAAVACSEFIAQFASDWIVVASARAVICAALLPLLLSGMSSAVSRSFLAICL